MWTPGPKLIAALLTAAALFPAPNQQAQEQEQAPAPSARQEERAKDSARPRAEIYVKAYPIQDITGYQERTRLEHTAGNAKAGDAARLEALKALEALRASGAVQKSTSEVDALIRRMMHPAFDPDQQSLFAGDGAELLVSGNRMQHNSVRLLLRELRSDDRFVKLVISVYELPPEELPPFVKAREGDRNLGSRYRSWLMERVSSFEKPTYERTVAGEIGRPIRVSMTRKVPVVRDYRRRALLDSDEAVLEPVVEEIIEGPVIEALIGRFQKVQLVVKASLDLQSCRRPIPTRTIRLENGDDVVVQVPEIDEVSGGATIHTGFDGPGAWLATITPVPTKPRTDYFVVLRVTK